MDSTKSSHRNVNWWWVLFGGFLTAFNAVILQQQQSYHRNLLDKMHAQLEEAEQRLSRSEQESFQFSELSVREIITMGQLFFDHKSTYEVLDDDLKDQLKQLNDTLPDQMEYLTESGYKMLSVKISEEEKSTGKLRAATIQAMTSRLREAGLVVIPSLHEPERCRKLAHKVHQDILDPWVEYGIIKRREYRKDLPLQLDGDYLDILHDTLQLLHPIYKETLGESPVLKEFSSLTSYPGSGEQSFHSDTKAETLEDFERDGLLYSAFIYLDDVGEFTAPFDAYPGTHGHLNIVDALMRKEQGSDYENVGPYVRMTVPQGSMVIYDSRLIHRGSANTSPLTRPTLYFSLQESTRESPYGSSYSLHPHYKGKDITLDDIVVTRDILPAFVPVTTPHNDLQCQVAMQRACPGDYDDPDDFFECAEDEHDDESPLRGCALKSRMERIAGARIFEQDFEAKVTWGNL